MADKTKAPEEIRITSIEEIKDRMAERVVELPGFGDGAPFAARVRRLGLLEMVQGGDVPNELLSTVNELYTKGTGGLRSIKDAAQVYHYYAARVLVEPSLRQIEEAGLQLTDRQLMAIYFYGIGGAESLKIFR